MEVHKMGGGIHFTVNHVREASEDELYESLMERLHRMSKCGTTTLEAKSGYGLDAENEIKMLRVIEKARWVVSSLVMLVSFMQGSCLSTREIREIYIEIPKS